MKCAQAFPLPFTNCGWWPSTVGGGGVGSRQVVGLFRIQLFKLEETLTYPGQPPPF